MDINEYVTLSKRTIASLHNPKEDNLHMVLGMLTEVGELADQFKKNLAYGREIDYTNVKEEVGDLMFYIAGLCSINEFDLHDILIKNVEKLKVRYPEKFTEYHATHRDLEKERQILES